MKLPKRVGAPCARLRDLQMQVSLPTNLHLLSIIPKWNILGVPPLSTLSMIQSGIVTEIFRMLLRASYNSRSKLFLQGIFTKRLTMRGKRIIIKGIRRFHQIRICLQSKSQMRKSITFLWFIKDHLPKHPLPLSVLNQYILSIQSPNLS
jgi:hypothetical protein